MRLRHIAFTRESIEHQANEDRVLVQGLILADGFSPEGEAGTCRAFVADGVGGSPAPARASEFVVRGLLDRVQVEPELSGEQLRQELLAVNRELVRAHAATEWRGLASTLAGVLLAPGQLRVITVGDSEVWVIREERIFSIAEPQNAGSIPGAPVTSYFGGRGDALSVSLDTTLDEVRAGDIFLVCSDGLFKAIGTRQARLSLSREATLTDRAVDLLAQAEAAGLKDDTSCALVEVIEA